MADPMTIAAVGGGIAQGLSQALGAVQQGKMSKEQLAEMIRQFNAQQQLARGGMAVGAQGQLDAMPMKDRVMYNMMQRLGASPQQFVARDMFNPQNGPAQQGGIDMGAMAQKIGAYTPGAGGQDPGALQKFLAVLGYGAGSTPYAQDAPFASPTNKALTPTNAAPAAAPGGLPSGAATGPAAPPPLQRPDYASIPGEGAADRYKRVKLLKKNYKKAGGKDD